MSHSAILLSSKKPFVGHVEEQEGRTCRHAKNCTLGYVM